MDARMRMDTTRIELVRKDARMDAENTEIVIDLELY